MRGWLTPPNLISILRICAAPWLGWELAEGNFRIALPLLLLVALSDALDGYLARHFNWKSELGEKLDPLADKILAATLYICFSWQGMLSWGLTALVLGRDAMILGLAALGLTSGRARRFPPSIWGKLSTVCQLTLAAACVLRAGWHDLPPQQLFTALVWAVVVTTAWSGVHYLWKAVRVLRSDHH